MYSRCHSKRLQSKLTSLSVRREVLVIYNYLYLSALLSTEILTILLKGIEPLPLGRGLGIQENRLQAIMTYYNYSSEKATEHVVGMWLRSDPKDPIKQLTVALKAVNKDDVAQDITVLSAPFKYGKKQEQVMAASM